MGRGNECIHDPSTLAARPEAETEEYLGNQEPASLVCVAEMRPGHIGKGEQIPGVSL